jgi:hypothetical protein
MSRYLGHLSFLPVGDMSQCFGHLSFSVRVLNPSLGGVSLSVGELRISGGETSFSLGGVSLPLRGMNLFLAGIPLYLGSLRRVHSSEVSRWYCCLGIHYYQDVEVVALDLYNRKGLST